ncbi:MAG: response regulator [Nitrospinota bacterium]|nr:response regulator [Nitrospinota bacterium]
MQLDSLKGAHILIVDDQQAIAQKHQKFLAEYGCDSDIAEDGNTALEMVKGKSYDLIIADINISGLGGIELIGKLRKIDKMLYVIIITGMMETDLTIKAIKFGVVDYLIKPVQQVDLADSVKKALERGRRAPAPEKTIGSEEIGFTESAFYSASLFIDAIESKTKYFNNWSEAVADLCMKLGKALKMQENDLWNLRSAAILHDIGNYDFEHGLIEKKTLSNEEKEMLKNHTQTSASISTSLNASEEVAEIIRHHHERFDGLGYPDGLKGDSIPLGSRILTIIDAYVAMRSERPYRASLDKETAISELRKHSGEQFDPVIIKKFIKILEREGDA